MDVVVITLLMSLYLFPIPYIFYKKGRNKFLFVSSVVGATTIIELLLALVTLPIIVAILFLVPNLDYSGYAGNISYLIRAAEFVGEYYFILVSWLNIWLSILIFRKFDFFRNAHNNRMQSDAAEPRR